MKVTAGNNFTDVISLVGLVSLIPSPFLYYYQIALIDQLNKKKTNCIGAWVLKIAKSGIQLNSLEMVLKHCCKRIYSANAVIYNVGDHSGSLFYIFSGSLMAVGEDYSGREVTLCYHNPGEFVGETGFFDNRPRHALLRTRSGCELGEITYSKFRSLSGRYPDLIPALAAQLAGRLRNTSRKVCDLVFLDVKSRVAHALLDLCREPTALSHTEGRQLRVTRREIASYVGCSREIAGKALKEFQQRGLVNVSGKTIVIFHSGWNELLCRSHKLTEKSL